MGSAVTLARPAEVRHCLLAGPEVDDMQRCASWTSAVAGSHDSAHVAAHETHTATSTLLTEGVIPVPLSGALAIWADQGVEDPGIAPRAGKSPLLLPDWLEHSQMLVCSAGSSRLSGSPLAAGVSNRCSTGAPPANSSLAPLSVNCVTHPPAPEDSQTSKTLLSCGGGRTTEALLGRQPILGSHVLPKAAPFRLPSPLGRV